MRQATRTKNLECTREYTQKESINHQLKTMLDATLWRNSAEVIEWFVSVQKKERCTFVNFDIVEFYLSISPTLLVNI